MDDERILKAVVDEKFGRDLLPKIRGKYVVSELEDIPAKEITNFTNDQYLTVEITEDMTVWRVNDNGILANKAGRYMTFTDIRGMTRDELKQFLAIKDEWNNITHIAEIKIPKGTKINIGTAKEQIEDGIKLSGGGDQIFLNVDNRFLEKIEKEWIISNDPL